jgi:hypothetical protein
LLVTSRQIYGELIDMWYETATFEILIRQEIYFFDTVIKDQNEKLQANFRRIHSLVIVLALDWRTEL